MSTLWSRFTRTYGSIFPDRFGVKDDGTWFGVLKQFSQMEIRTGLSKLRKQYLHWPPNAYEFAELCSHVPEDFGLPDPDTAYLQACHFDWTHAIVWRASAEVGQFEIRSMPERTMKPRFVKKYLELFELYKQGVRFAIDTKPEQQSLPYVPLERNDVRNCIAEMKNILKRSTTNTIEGNTNEQI